VHSVRGDPWCDGVLATSRLPVKTLLICHEGAALHRDGISRWLASFSELAGILILREGREARWRRAKREWRRSGALRLADALAFRMYYKLFLAATDKAWEERAIDDLCTAYPPIDDGTAVLTVRSPNSAEAEQFIRARSPNVGLALCKTLLKPRIFSIPTHGTFVLHPGICPEYRNAHGCFWALANDDFRKVGMSLLRIDEGIDTGPVFGHYTYPYDERLESHIVIQHRVITENLDALRAKFRAIYEGSASPIDTSGRKSATWGQPWLTSYVKWKYKAKRRRLSESAHAALS
jgi:hypothetical protein